MQNSICLSEMKRSNSTSLQLSLYSPFREKGLAFMGIAAMLGTPVKRREDPRLITAQATHVDDIKLDGMLHMASIRSTYGQARINRINSEDARQLTGVVAVYTAADLKGQVGNIAIAVPLGHIANGMGVHGALAEGKVRFYGDPVAAVI